MWSTSYYYLILSDIIILKSPNNVIFDLALLINIKKTKIVCFRPMKTRSQFESFFLEEELIENVKSYCYLGIVFHENCSFKVAENELRKKALRALFGLKRNIIKSSLSTKSLFILFDSLVKPVLLYGSQVVFAHSDIVKYLNKDKCLFDSGEVFLKNVASNLYEKFHLKYIKWCLSVHYKASNVGCWGETGRYPLYVDAIKMAIDYYNRVEDASSDTLLHEAFIEQKSLQLDWYANLQSIICKFGHGRALNASVNFKISAQRIFEDRWTDVKNTSPKLEFYNTLKDKFGFENHLLLSNSDHKNALTKLRISAHKLYIEAGRYVQPPIPRNKRFCLYCKSILHTNLVESEVHVLNDCPLYKSVRLMLPDEHSSLFEALKVSPNSEFDANIGYMIYLILEIHDKFNHYYSDSQFMHQSTGSCIIL